MNPPTTTTKMKDDDQNTDNKTEKDKPNKNDLKNDVNISDAGISSAANTSSIQDSKFGTITTEQQQDLAGVKMEYTPDGSTLEVKKIGLTESTLNVKSHLAELDQKCADEYAANLIKSINSNIHNYVVGFGIDSLPKSETLPYYQIIDFENSDAELPCLFTTKSYISDYYNRDDTVTEQEYNVRIFDTHPVLKKSQDSYKVNTYKIVVDWDGTGFYSPISDPRSITDETIINKVAYVGTYLSDRYQDYKAFSRLKTFFEMTARANILLVGLKRKQISICLNKTKISNLLDTKYVLLNDKPNLIFNGIYHVVPEFCDRINGLLANGQNEYNAREFFRTGRDVTLEVSRLDIRCRGYTNIDQFTAYFINNAYERIVNNKFTVNDYTSYLLCNYPSGYRVVTQDTFQDNLIYNYKPSKKDWNFALFVIMIDISIKEKMILLFEELTSSRNLFSNLDNGLLCRTIINNKIHNQSSSGLITYFLNFLSDGSSDRAIKLITAEFFASFVNVRVRSEENSFEYIDFFRIIEVLVGFIVTPKLCWWNADQYGRILDSLLYTYANDEYSAWVNEYGQFVELKGNSFKPIQMDAQNYDNNCLRNNIYFSFLVPIQVSPKLRNDAPFISQIYHLISPKGQEVVLDRKRKTGYPYMHENFNGYVPWFPIDYRTISMVNPINQAVDQILLKTRGLITKYMKNNMNRSATKETYSAIAILLRNFMKNLGIVLHSTAAPLYRTMMDTFLYVIDGFNPNAPYKVPKLIGYSGYHTYNNRLPEQDLIGDIDLLGKAVEARRVQFELDTRIYMYVAIGLKGVLKTDCITGVGGYRLEKLYNPNNVMIGPLDGNKLTEFAFEIVGVSKRINEGFGILNMLHKNDDSDCLREVRERLKAYWSSANAAHLINVLSKEFNCPLYEYFRLEDFSGTLLVDPRIYKPTLFFINEVGDILPNQDVTQGVNKLYEFGDEYSKNIWKICSHVLFNDDMPIFLQTIGLVLGYFNLTSSDPSQFFDAANTPQFFEIDLDENFDYFSTEGDIGYKVKLSFKREDADIVVTNPYDTTIVPIKFKVKKIGNMPLIYLNFINEMLESRRHILVLSDIIVDYEILNMSKWSDYVPPEPLFPKLIQVRDVENIKVTFYDTRFIEEHDFTKLTKPYMLITYRNIHRLNDFMVAGGIFGNPNQAAARLVNIDRDNFCYGQTNELTSTYLVRGGNKIDGTVINFNNHISYLTKNARVRLPNTDITYSTNI